VVVGSIVLVGVGEVVPQARETKINSKREERIGFGFLRSICPPGLVNI